MLPNEELEKYLLNYDSNTDILFDIEKIKELDNNFKKVFENYKNNYGYNDKYLFEILREKMLKKI